MGKRIGGAQGNHAESGIASDHALQNVVYGSISSTGKDRVATFRDRMTGLRRCIRLAACRFQCRIDTTLAKDHQCSFDVSQPPHVRTAGERVVQKNGLAHSVIEQWTR